MSDIDVFELPVHPHADIFPMLLQEELDELTEDIKENGLREPIVLGEFEDGRDEDDKPIMKTWLVDGRNRREACKRAGIVPETRMLNGEDQTAFIVSANLMRRSMTKDQKTMAMAILYPKPEKGGRGKKTPQELRSLNDGRLAMARKVLRVLGLERAQEIVLSGGLEAASDEADNKLEREDKKTVADLIDELQDWGLEQVATGLREEKQTIGGARSALQGAKDAYLESKRTAIRTFLTLMEGAGAMVAWQNEKQERRRWLEDKQVLETVAEVDFDTKKIKKGLDLMLETLYVIESMKENQKD